MGKSRKNASKKISTWYRTMRRQVNNMKDRTGGLLHHWRDQCHVDGIINKCNPYRNNSFLKSSTEVCGALECMPTSSSSPHNTCNRSNQMQMASATTIGGIQTTSRNGVVGSVGSSNVTLSGSNIMYPLHMNLNTSPNLQHHLQDQQQQLQHHQLENHHHLLSHQIPYSNNYHPLHHSNSHHNIHSEQTKSLQELQHEVGALLEFRDLVIETFPDLKQKMASMSSATSQIATTNNCSVNAHSSNSNANSVNSNTITASSSGTTTSSTMRREWEPGIRPKRKGQKDPSTSGAAAAQASSSTATPSNNSNVAGDICSSLTRSRSNSHSGKKEPKSGENNNGSVVQDSGFSTETSSSKEGHSASSTNGALPASHPLNRISADPDDELLNLLDVIHRKSSRLREEVEQLQTYERQNLQGGHIDIDLTPTTSDTMTARPNIDSLLKNLNPKTFREHVERINREDIKHLRKERDRLLDKLAEMEAETLTGRIKAAKMNHRVEELMNVKKDLEEQLKLAMIQKLELSSRLQQLQLQQQSGKSSSSQSESSSQRNFASTATTVLSNSSNMSSVLNTSQVDSAFHQQQRQRQNTFQPLVVDLQQQDQKSNEDALVPFHQSSAGDNNQSQQNEQHLMLGHLDGIVSTPGSRNLKSRTVDSKRFSAILLENNVLELKRHLLTLTVHNQVLASKLDKTSKSNSNLSKRLEKQKEDIEDLRFQLEEKNIELEGTKAQLRVVESRYPSATPSSSGTTNSYLHSHHDYETNRSSASTTLVLSRRSGGGSGIDSNISSDNQRPSSPLIGSSALREMPAPVTSQISTPSMKAMVPLAMDDLQQHSSSTESAHDHEITLDNGSTGAGFMSSSVGSMSPFEQSKTLTPTQLALKKFMGGGSKPSKIPLPGSKAASYCAGKPPTGRPSTAGRSPPSANGSYSSNKSLSRSTGNLLYNKSPNTSSTSLSTNTSRSSTNSSSIPLAVTPHTIASRLFTSTISPVSSTTTMTTTTPPTPTSTNAAIKTTNSHNPSSRILQNSPLPKLKRETFSSRIRHSDSLSRAHYQHQQQQQEGIHSNDLSTKNLSNISNNSSNTSSSCIISSTPKPSAIAAQINSSIRKELQLSSSSFSPGILRRPSHGNNINGVGNSSSNGGSSDVGGGNGNGSASNTLLQPHNITTRRFSSASIVGARAIAAARNHEQQQVKQHSTSTLQADHNGHQQHQLLNQHQYHSNSGNSGNGSNASDSDSGKRVTFKCKLSKLKKTKH